MTETPHLNDLLTAVLTGGQCRGRLSILMFVLTSLRNTEVSGT